MQFYAHLGLAQRNAIGMPIAAVGKLKPHKACRQRFASYLVLQVQETGLDLERFAFMLWAFTGLTTQKRTKTMAAQSLPMRIPMRTRLAPTALAALRSTHPIPCALRKLSSFSLDFNEYTPLKLGFAMKAKLSLFLFCNQNCSKLAPIFYA